MTIAEKFVAISKVNGLPGEMIQFLNERAEKQTKANATPRKANAQSTKLQDAILSVLSDGERVMADDVENKLNAIGYEDEHKQGLTIARVRAGLSALAKDGAIVKFDADRKKNADFPKVSYQVEQEQNEVEGE